MAVRNRPVRPAAHRGKGPAGSSAEVKPGAPPPAETASAGTASAAAKPATRRRAVPPAERREAILAAALAEFSARGFAATRLDDVARRAGIAKGTIYLYFDDKELLFQELVRTRLSPLVGAVHAEPGDDLRRVAERVIGLFMREVYGTERKDVFKLLVAEGQRFPSLAEFYFKEVVAPMMGAMRGLLGAAMDQGEPRHRVLAQYPQLLIAPGLVAVLWSALFSRVAPLDAEGLMRAHLELLFGRAGSETRTTP